jgi:hypothetical protein
MRIYDNKYLSVTSVIDIRKPFNKEAFDRWCEKVGKDPDLIIRTSQILGDKVSELIDNRSRSLEWMSAPPVDQLEQRLYSGVEDFMNEYRVLETERVVKCEELHYAGRFDGIIESGGTKYLADWKTYGAWKNKEYKRVSSKIRKVRWQLSMYAHAIEWEGKLAVVVFKNDGTWELEELDFDHGMIEWVKDNQKEIIKLINNYNEDK